ncbi:MAG: amino acid ABC transporter permease, partial [Shimia sp.]
TLVFFTGFPTWQQRGDALYYANYFADKTFNPFVPYPILAFYFIVLTLCIIGAFGLVNRRLNRHMPRDARVPLRLRMNLIR